MRLYNYLEILDESINDKGILKAGFITGNPGAGKSYTLTRINDGSIDPRIVNTDKFTEWFGNGGSADWATFGSRIKTLTKIQLAQYINSLLPLWIDTTATNPNTTFKRAGLLSSLGYDVDTCVWVNTSLETSLERNAKRQRHVPEDFLTDAYNKAQAAKPFFQAKFANFIEVNNDIGELTNEVVLKTFNSAVKFFMSPVKNKLGQKIIDELKLMHGKYMSDLPTFSMDGIMNQVNGWFSK